MKKYIYLIVSFFVLSLTSLQAQTNSGGYVPEKGSIALGASANLSNLFYNIGSSSNVPSLSLQYFLSSDMAVRATFGVNSATSLNESYVRDDAAYVLNPLSNIQVIDSKKDISNSYNSSIAAQKYFGEGKLRYYVGVQAIYGAGSSKTNYTYANPMGAMNPYPTSLSGAYSNSTGTYTRTLESKTGSTYSVGGGVIAGFEFYVLSRLSIGGEMSLNAIYSHSGQTNSKSETVVNGEVVTIDNAVSPGAESLNIKSVDFFSKDNNEQLGVYIMYHF